MSSKKESPPTATEPPPSLDATREKIWDAQADLWALKTILYHFQGDSTPPDQYAIGHLERIVAHASVALEASLNAME